MKKLNNDPWDKELTGKTYYEHMLEEPNSLNKRHPYDCGRKDCMICHCEKLLKKEKHSDKKRKMHGK